MDEEMVVEAQPARNAGRYAIVMVLVVGAFFGAYRYADAQTAAPVSAQTPPSQAAVAGGPADGAASAGCACCGSTAPTADGVTGEKTRGSAVVEGDVQRIGVDLSKGYYDPNVIVLKAGVPAEVTFGQSSGCTGQVMSQDLGFSEDLTTGPKTVSLPALGPGQYAFSCGMQMVFGKIVVE